MGCQFWKRSRKGLRVWTADVSACGILIRAGAGRGALVFVIHTFFPGKSR